MSAPTDRTVSLQLIIEKPPAGILYGLQRGSGTTYVTEQPQLSDASDLVFELVMPVKAGKGGTVSFAGPYAQGTATSRFVYIGMGSYAGQKGAVHNGRLKIPLPELSENLLVYAERGGVFTARFPGTDSKMGRPRMATVQPEGGWVLAS